MCYEIYPISHFLFERQKNRHLATACRHSGLEKSHFTSRRYYPSLGGCQASTFNYTKDPHKRLGCWLSICMVNDSNDIPQRMAFGSSGWQGASYWEPSRQVHKSVLCRETSRLCLRTALSLLESHRPSSPSFPLSRLIGGCAPPTEPRNEDPAPSNYSGPAFPCRPQGRASKCWAHINIQIDQISRRFFSHTI